MKPYRYFKETAKRSLTGNFTKCIIAFLFVSLLPTLISLLETKLGLGDYRLIIISLITTLVLIPCFRMGAIGFLFNSMRKKEVSFGDMFDGFKYFFKLIPLALAKIISFIPLILVCILFLNAISPETMDILTKYVADPLSNMSLLETISDSDYFLMLLCEALLIGCVIFVVVADTYLALTEYILFNEQLSGFKSVFKSIKMMKGHILYYIGFSLSFILWLVASTFTMGLSNLVLYPYREASYIMFYNYLRYINGEGEKLEAKEIDETQKEE